MDEALRAELLALLADDDTTRERLARDGSLFAGYHPEMEAVHRRNAGRLRAMVEAHGWPGRAAVGNDAASAAWRILQHSIGEPELMRGLLPLVRAAVERGDASAAELAMLEDRICTCEGRLQRYGTQFDWNDDGTAMVPMVGVEDPERLDERRAAVGLPPMAWRQPPAAGEPVPADLAGRRAEMDAWARRVGWR
jgi:hypothetical protein